MKRKLTGAAAVSMEETGDIVASLMLTDFDLVKTGRGLDSVICGYYVTWLRPSASLLVPWKPHRDCAIGHCAGCGLP